MSAAFVRPAFRVVARTVLEDKIRGGLRGQILGNLNGIPHEMKYIHTPGTVTGYEPNLPDGAYTDDDTAIEWTHTWYMKQEGTLTLPYARLVEIWQSHMKPWVMSSNQFALLLMEIGIKPPFTGRSPINPYAAYNLAGQFTSETYALLSPGMPRRAAELGLHYVHVAVEAEPAQATQLFAGMIAAAFFVDDLEEILAAGLAATDPDSSVSRIVRDVWQSWREHPNDWSRTRHEILQRYQRHEGEGRDMNGYETNTASVVGAFLHGQGDPARSLELAFNFGWDSDCNAATVGTLVGVLRGARFMTERHWEIGDRYRNTADNGLIREESISAFENRLIELALKNVVEQGGTVPAQNGGSMVTVRTQTPIVIEPIRSVSERKRNLLDSLHDAIERDLENAMTDYTSGVRAAYLAIALDQQGEWSGRNPEGWNRAVEALRGHEQLLPAVFRTPRSSGAASLLRLRFRRAGLTPTASESATAY